MNNYGDHYDPNKYYFSNSDVNKDNLIFSNNYNDKNRYQHQHNENLFNNNIELSYNNNISNNNIFPNINDKNREEDISKDISYSKRINLNYFDNKNLLEELRAKYLPDYNKNELKKAINLETSLTKSDKNNNNDGSEGSIQAQKLINEDSSHLNPFQSKSENIKSNSFRNKEEEKNNKKEESFKNQENQENNIIQNDIENKENKENNQLRNNDKNANININLIKNKDNDNNDNNNIRNKYYTEIVSSDNLFNGEMGFNPFSKSSSTLMNNYTNYQKNNDNKNNKEDNRNIHNNNIKLSQNDPNHISFSLKNININNNSNNNSEIPHNYIHKEKSLPKEENEITQSYKNKDTINSNINLKENINDIQNKSNNLINNQFQNSKVIEKRIDKNIDEYKENLILENNNLKKEIKNYEQLMKPLINYINNLNVKLGQKEINPNDINIIVKSDKASFYINNLEKNLINSDNEITKQINKMNETIKINNIRNKIHNHNHNQIYNKLYYSDNNINNIKVKKINKSDDDDDDDENFIIRNVNKYNFGKGNFFYEDLRDKYFYNYYKDRSINCPACIIGNCNSERGFSPVICCHLDKRTRYFSSEEINNDKDNLINISKN